MSIGINFGGEERPSVRPQAVTETKSTSFCVAIIGDFSGSKHSRTDKFVDRKPIPIDRDNLEAVMRRLEVGLENLTLSPDRIPFSLQFCEIDDFHPDSLFQNLELFQTFRKLRQQLQDPQTFPSAAATVRSWLSAETRREESAPPPASKSSVSESSATLEDINKDNLLDQILEQHSASTPANNERSQWQEVIHEIVAPHALPGTDPELPELLECLDSVISKSMTYLLTNVEFRNLERNWRLLQQVVRVVETSRQFKMYIVDVSHQELIDSLQNSNSINQSELFQVLDIEGSGETRWDLIVSTETFSLSSDATELLSRLGLVSLSTQGVLLGAADGSHVGCPPTDRHPDPTEWAPADDAEANALWTRLKASPLASAIGLFWPSVLVRLPYGRQTNPINSFQYEELSGIPQSAELLWGSPALLAIILYARAMTIPPENLRPEDLQRIDGMPFLTYKSDGETNSYPCSEFFLNESAIEKALAAGLSAIVAIRDQDAIRFPKIRSLNGTSLL